MFFMQNPQLLRYAKGDYIHTTRNNIFTRRGYFCKNLSQPELRGDDIMASTGPICIATNCRLIITFTATAVNHFDDSFAHSTER